MASNASTVVVGDRFVGFAVQEGVLTVSQLLSELQVHTHEPGARTVVRAGQGVGDFEWRQIHEEVRRRGLQDVVALVRPHAKLASRAECHKRSEPNALIANVRRTGEGLFRASLRIHNDNELLLDHQTGQHVQGMVALEAARQMFLSVTERYYASAYPQRRYYYVIDVMSIDFENFLFPLDAEIEYQVLTADLADPERLTFTVQVALLQSGRRTSLTKIAFSAFDEEKLKPTEHRRAVRAIEHLREELLEPVGV